MREYLIYHTTALALAIVLDALAGDPHVLWHPIRAIGTLISWLEKVLYRSSDSMLVRGTILWLVVMAVTGSLTAAVLVLSYRWSHIAGAAVETVLTYFILAAGSLRDESMKVYKALPDVEKARSGLSMIVGRDTKRLDEAGIVRATVETIAENTSDGVLAPLLYTAIGGPILGMCYKAVNTMDSMLGYNNERYTHFGRFAARADNVANFIASRISALFMIAGAGILRMDPAGAFKIWRRDRLNHKSPNSAQTESACAGALGVRLGGDAHYGGILVRKPYIGDDIRSVEAEDIKRAIRLMFAAEALCTAVIMVVMLILISRSV